MLDAALQEVKAALGDDPVVRAVAGIVSPETIAAGEPIRAIDALLVAEQLDAAIGRRPAPSSRRGEDVADLPDRPGPAQDAFAG